MNARVAVLGAVLTGASALAREPNRRVVAVSSKCAAEETCAAQ
jgi:hypothetical protein